MVENSQTKHSVRVFIQIAVQRRGLLGLMRSHKSVAHVSSFNLPQHGTHTRLIVCCALFFFRFHIQTAKKSACWEDIAAGVCKDKADFTPDVKTEEGKDTTCYGLASYVGMTATAQCTGTNPTGTPWASMTALVAQKCCGGKFIHDDSVVCVFPFFRSRSFHREEERLTT